MSRLTISHHQIAVFTAFEAIGAKIVVFEVIAFESEAYDRALTARFAFDFIMLLLTELNLNI